MTLLTHDYDLKISDLQRLANADAVAGLFTSLGYNTDARLKQNPQAMGFPDGLAREVLAMERLADQEQELQVYLIELKRVTVAITQMLARTFKLRAGLYLLVLTADYERLDFVLFDPLPVERAGGEAGKKQTGGLGQAVVQAILRPRILTVERRNPGSVALRVLRRFSYTEVDPLYQWDKLRSAYGVAEWAEPLFNNRALFSDYYLNERLPQRPEWQEDPRPAFRAIGNRYVIASLIACAPDTPRLIGEADVFAIQDKIQANILAAIQTQAALEAAPQIIEPIQQTVATLLRQHLQNPALKRSQVRQAIKSLGQPMVRAALRQLQSAYETFQANSDVSALLAAVFDGITTPTETIAPSPALSRPLNADDLHLICWEYVWS